MLSKQTVERCWRLLPILARKPSSYEKRNGCVTLRSETLPIWDGKAALTVRRAEEREITAFQDARSGVRDEDADDILLAYLIPLDGPGLSQTDK